jgi:hypothetical protein
VVLGVLVCVVVVKAGFPFGKCHLPKSRSAQDCARRNAGGRGPRRACSRIYDGLMYLRTDALKEKTLRSIGRGECAQSRELRCLYGRRTNKVKRQGKCMAKRIDIAGLVAKVGTCGEEILHAGDADGHCLQNRSKADAVVLEIGTRYATARRTRTAARRRLRPAALAASPARRSSGNRVRSRDAHRAGARSATGSSPAIR